MAEQRRPLTHDQIADLAPGFVLGALEPDEAAAIRAHLATCDEPHPAIEELGAVVPALLESVEVVEPPASLRDRILEAAATPAPESPDAAVAARGRRRLTSLTGLRAWLSRPGLAWVAAAVAAVLVVALGVRTLQVQAELGALQAYREGVVAVLDTAAMPGSQLAVLSSPEDSGPAGIAAASTDGRIAIAMRDLDPTRGSEVYETWLIGDDGVPVPVGSFTAASGGTASMVLTVSPAASAGVTIALTHEPGPGATTPTPPIVAVGTAQPVT
jgi:anti-sigma-K factor RskA